MCSRRDPRSIRHDFRNSVLRDYFSAEVHEISVLNTVLAATRAVDLAGTASQKVGRVTFSTGLVSSLRERKSSRALALAKGVFSRRDRERATGLLSCSAVNVNRVILAEYVNRNITV